MKNSYTELHYNDGIRPQTKYDVYILNKEK